MKNRTQFFNILFLFLSLLSLTACVGKAPFFEKEKIISETIDWKNKGFNVSEGVMEEQGLWVKEYIPWMQNDERLVDNPQEQHIVEAGIHNGKIYRFVQIKSMPVSGKMGYVLKIYGIKTKETEFLEFPYEQMTQYGKNAKDSKKLGTLVECKVIDDNQYVVQWCEWQDVEEQYKQSGQKIFYYEGDKVTQVTDVWESYLEYQIVDDEVRDVSLVPRISSFYDGMGNSYVLGDLANDEYTGVYVFDCEGVLLSRYKGEEYQKIQEPFCMESGELIFPIYDTRQKRYSFRWLNMENKDWKEVATFKSSQMFRKVFGIQGKWIYYELPQGIVQWNIETGERDLTFSYRDNGIATDYQTMMAFFEGEAPILRIYSGWDGEDDWLVPMSFEKLSDGETVCMVDIVTSTNAMERRLSTECAALVSRKEHSVLYTYEKPVGDWEDYRDKIFRELALGEGPDLMYVTLEDFEILEKKGLLMDLGSIVPEETLVEILPGVLEIGTVDGRLLGLPFEVSVSGLVVSGDTWGKNSWTLDEYLGLMRKGKIERAIYYCATERYFAPLASIVRLQDVMNNPHVLDWENKKSYFNGKPFLDLLQLLNVNRNNFETDTDTWFNNGERVAFYDIDSSKDLCDFISLMEMNNGVFVGFPTEGQNGNYLQADGVIVVNKNASNIDAIKKYFQYLLGDEIQGMCDQEYRTKMSVKKLNLDKIETDSEGRMFWDGKELQIKEDGTTSFHKAKEFLENCTPAPHHDEQILIILREELPSFFEGQKSVKQVVDIIQSRVQLYLDEGN